MITVSADVLARLCAKQSAFTELTANLCEIPVTNSIYFQCIDADRVGEDRPSTVPGDDLSQRCAPHHAQ